MKCRHYTEGITEFKKPGSGDNRRGTKGFRGVEQFFQSVDHQVSPEADTACINSHFDFLKLESG